MSTSVDSIKNANSTSNSATSSKSTTLGKDDFLKMMLAQLKNQDPLNPMDGSQYSAQLAQFSSLEQLTNLNTNLTSFINTNLSTAQSITNTMSTNLIGKDVRIDTNKFTYNGQSTIKLGYNVPQATSNVTISIYDSNGKLVKTYDKVTSAQGDNSINWDFKAGSGYSVSKGDYTYTVTAKSSGGSEITATPFQSGAVSSVKFTTDGAKLVINGIEYDFANVSQIANSTTP